ncbi:universal stress protein [Pseudomonas aeruginosa]|nr:universal stress protein [Pseudomonas aeruginosa]MCO3826033.1 universal stress protein [Pseudomonas aeruginosa]MCO3829187.1 universal stress protein [Pseudomonas aeruginosa]MCO3845594.1 universal stress protein [Pseudomonas aeruginosa]OPE11403.1 universal stress protein [Pseudomonas aeruginosa]
MLIGHERLLPEGDSVFIMDFRAARGTCSVAPGKKLLRRGRIRL